MRKSDVELTTTKCEREKPTEKKQVLWDSKTTGLCLVITPQHKREKDGQSITIGGVKTWFFVARRAGKQQWVRIGGFVPRGEGWTLVRAREEAERLRVIHDQGRDVKAAKAKERTRPTVAKLVEDYREELIGKLKPKSQKCAEGYFAREILPRFKDRLVAEIGVADLQRMHNEIAGDGKPYAANRVLAAMSRLLNLAESKEWRPLGTNPTKHVERSPETARRTVLDAKGYAAIEKALVKLSTKPGKLKANEKPRRTFRPAAADAIRFLALTGLRLNEALHLTWKDVDLEKGFMVIRDHKTAKRHGERTLPLNSHALAIVKARKDKSPSPFIFWGKPNSKQVFKPFVGLQHAWERVRHQAKLPDVRLHDLRRSFNSVAAELGYPAAVFDSLLGHALPGVQQVYTRLNVAGILATASQDVGDWIKAAMEGKGPKVGEKWG